MTDLDRQNLRDLISKAFESGQSYADLIKDLKADIVIDGIAYGLQPKKEKLDLCYIRQVDTDEGVVIKYKTYTLLRFNKDGTLSLAVGVPHDLGFDTTDDGTIKWKLAEDE